MSKTSLSVSWMNFIEEKNDLSRLKKPEIKETGNMPE